MNKITRIVPTAALVVCLAVGGIGTALSPATARNNSTYNMQSGAYHHNMMHSRQMTARQMMMRRQMMARQMMMRRQMRQRHMMRPHIMNQR